MTREDIMHMAREAGVRMDYIFDSGTTRWILQPGLMRFAALVAEAERERMTVNSIHSCGPDCQKPLCVNRRREIAAAVEAEREACARVCEERVGYWQRDDIRRDEDENCAAAIRARGSE